MITDSNIYKRPAARVQGMSSRQQVLYLLQKTQKEANWDMENDSDFQEDYSQEVFQNQGDNQQSIQIRSSRDCYSVPFNEEFEIKREKLVSYHYVLILRQRQQELMNHPERLRLLAHSLTQFTPIKRNKYLERKRHVLSEKEANSLLVCNCQRATAKKNEKTNPLQSFNCGERCINRCVSTECCAQTCPSGVFCKNRRFQLHQNAYVFPAKTEKKGWGLFAGEFIPKGSFVMQYVGEVFSVDSELGQQRVQKYKNSTCTYLMRTTNNEVIDPTYVGNIARFINHSCDPNCETQKWNVLGEVCVGIFALRDIKENEELSFDYQFDFFKTPFTKCYCGTAKCKGYLGVLSTHNADKSGENPSCAYCQEAIIDKEEIVVCNGFCTETFHIGCIIKKEGKTKAQAQAFMMGDKRNFICKDCIQKINSKKRRGRKSQKEIEELILLQQQQQRNAENLPENPQEDKDFNVNQEVPPWESKDPNVLKFFEDSHENRLLDKIIAREFEQIEQNLKEMNDLANSSSKQKRIRKKNAQFSEHYNFICELQKRLKMRIKENKKNYKFRKHRDDIKEMKLDKLQELEDKRMHKQMSSINNDDFKRKRGRPKKILSSSFIVENKHQLQLKPSQSAKIVRDIKEVVNEEEEEKQEEPSKDVVMDEHDLISQQSVGEASICGSIDEDEQEQDEEEEGDEEEEESLENEEEEEDEEDEEYDEEDHEESGEDGELNLEKLQGQIEAEEEERKTRIEEELKISSLNQFSDKAKISTESLLQKRLRGISDDIRQGLSSPINKSTAVLQTPDHSQQVSLQQQLFRKTPMKQLFQISPRKNSILGGVSSLYLENQNKDRLNIQNHVKTKIDTFINEQNSQGFTPSDLLVRESKFNVYEIVFNMVVPDNIEQLQCLPPAKFQIFWEQAWGGMVTVRINSTFKQYNFLTGLLQEVTDMMYKTGLLNGGGYSRADQISMKEIKKSFPFEIVMLKVPKNFIRKLVGYQEKTLTQYRKNYTVDFYFDRDLLTDDVFYMNETTQLRIFGRSQDVFAVNELIQKELEQIKIKTILLQMNDCKLVMDNVKEVKVMVDPCEIRVKKMTREWKDLRHPFYYLPNYFREMVLIGTDREIQYAENQIDLFFSSRRDQNSLNVQQISYLLPIYFKNLSMDIKNLIYQRCPQIQIFFYEPTFPRKHLTVLMIGPWPTLLLAKQILEDQANLYMQRNAQSFEMFQQFTYHQQIRFSFKSLKRFVLEQDIKYLNHWDLCSIFVEEAGKQVQSLDWHQILNSGPLIQPTDTSPLLFSDEQQQTLQRSASQQFTTNSSFPPQLLMAANQSYPMKGQESNPQCKDKDYLALIDFLKNQDIETCINSMFVLIDSKKSEESLRNMMERLQVNKNELIQYMCIVLQKNIDEYEESLKFFQGRSYESAKVSGDIHGYEGDNYSLRRSARDSHRSRSSSHHRPYYNSSSYSTYHHGHYDYKKDYQPQFGGSTLKQFDYQQSQGEREGSNKPNVSHSRNRSHSRSKRRRRGYSSDSSERSRRSSHDRRSYHGWRSSRRIHESPDFTRPNLDYRPSYYSRDYYRNRSPSRHSYYHSHSRPYYNYRSYRDNYRDYKYSDYHRGYYNDSHRYRSRSKHRRDHYYRRRSDSGDSSDYRRSRRHSHRDRESSRDYYHRRRHQYRSKSRSRSYDSYYRRERSRYDREKSSREVSRSPDNEQRNDLIRRYKDHPYFSRSQLRSLEVSNFNSMQYQRPKSKGGFDQKEPHSEKPMKSEPDYNQQSQSSHMIKNSNNEDGQI